MRSRTRLFAVLLTLAVLVPGAAARAQEAGASETALAREQYQDGMHFAQSGHWEQAYQAFSRAYALVHRPALLVNLASAEAQTNRLVEAAEHYRQFLREVTSGREASQRTAVQTALDALDPRIPRVRFVTTGAQAGDAYALDEHDLSAAVIGTPYPLDPGDHVLVVSAAGAEIARTRFSVAESQSTDVAVEIHRPAPVVDTHVHPVDDHQAPPDGLGEHHDDLPPPPVLPHDDGGVFASPIFWTIVGILVVGAGVSVGVVLATQGGREPFGGGNLGTTIVP